ncbi:ATP-binding cassette domain-containing protein [Halopelagius fulvigenes]|uniref:ATP-binding cassette domain-containing protein n=1 Tax=Halopelagius fulvigenes TaxID=1198324 RepID=A0ABD5U3C9_9EURY
MITVENLRKTYEGFPAVVGSSFEVDRGEIFGVVGPNGAGKTTTLKMLAGLIEPTAGAARVGEFDAGDPEMRRCLGFLPEESPLYEDMTPRSYLRFFADLHDVPYAEATRRTERTFDRLELEHRERRLGDMSKGMKRKVAIARSLVNDPDLLIYDEPASGLDPLTTNYVLEFTRELAERGKTIVFSAHNLYHVESVCDRVVIMNRGEIIARGTVPEIRDEHGETTYHVFTTVPVPDAEPVGDGRHRRVVADMDAVESVRAAAESAGGEVDVAVSGDATSDLIRAASSVGGIDARPYRSEDAAMWAFDRGDADAVLSAERLHGRVFVTATAPDSNIATTVVVVRLRDALREFERTERAERSAFLTSSTLELPSETKSSPYYGFTYTVLVPLLLYLPVFISGSITVDSITEEIDRGTLELLRVAPLSLSDVVDGKLLAAATLAPAQSVLWILLLGVNGTPVSNPLSLLVMVAALSTLVCSLGAAVALLSPERRAA